MAAVSKAKEAKHDSHTITKETTPTHTHQKKKPTVKEHQTTLKDAFHIGLAAYHILGKDMNCIWHEWR